ncbi:hypothetical protein [Roseateles microcysteis]|uniref:hypothetical protein n=1 Tax=Roseateles microcysteis TaxID=3119057 RepID=UPI002FE65097
MRNTNTFGIPLFRLSSDQLMLPVGYWIQIGLCSAHEAVQTDALPFAFAAMSTSKALFQVLSPVFAPIPQDGAVSCDWRFRDGVNERTKRLSIPIVAG